MNLYVRYRDLSRAIMAPTSPALPESFDSGAFGGAFVCFVVQVDSQLREVDFIVGTYTFVMLDSVVPLTFFELF